MGISLTAATVSGVFSTKEKIAFCASGYIHSDVLLVDGLDQQFDIVTMVGSTRMESGLYERILEKAFSFLKDGGSLYYQTLDGAEAKEDLAAFCGKNGIKIDRYLLDAAYGYQAQYFKLTNANPRKAH